MQTCCKIGIVLFITASYLKIAFLFCHSVITDVYSLRKICVHVYALPNEVIDLTSI